jgi:hypothetical protein
MKKNKSWSEGFHVDDSTYSSRAVVGRSSASLALQSIMGLLPQQRPWLGGGGFTRAVAGWATVTPSGAFAKPMPSQLDERVGSIGSHRCLSLFRPQLIACAALVLETVHN